MRAMTLQDVARRAAERHDGASGRQLARIAEAAGFQISHTILNAMLAGTYDYKPSWVTLEALAYLADLPESAVFEAAKVPMPGKSFAEQLPPEADLLDERERKVIIDLIKTMAAAHKEKGLTDASLLEFLQRTSGQHGTEGIRLMPPTEPGGAWIAYAQDGTASVWSGPTDVQPGDTTGAYIQSLEYHAGPLAAVADKGDQDDAAVVDDLATQARHEHDDAKQEMETKKRRRTQRRSRTSKAGDDQQE